MLVRLLFCSSRWRLWRPSATAIPPNAYTFFPLFSFVLFSFRLKLNLYINISSGQNCLKNCRFLINKLYFIFEDRIQPAAAGFHDMPYPGICFRQFCVVNEIHINHKNLVENYVFWFCRHLKDANLSKQADAWRWRCCKNNCVGRGSGWGLALVIVWERFHRNRFYSIFSFWTAPAEM